MARARPAMPPSRRALGTPSRAATDLAQLLSARTFCLSGEGTLIARVAANLLATGGRVEEDAAAWIGLSTPPDGHVALCLGDAAGALGPYSFGFLNNLTGVAPLAAPFTPAELPRRGHIAWVVPRRDALPEVTPLLAARGLGVSWLISVGDGDPAEVLRFLGLCPATSGILLALGRGVRPQSLREALGEKPVVLLEPPSFSGKDCALVRAVARRAGAVVTTHLEDWLAHAALLDAVAERTATGADAAKARRLRAEVVVAGAGLDFVTSEVKKAGAQKRAQLKVRSVDSEEAVLIEDALRQAAKEAEIVVLCGAGDMLAEVATPGPLLRIDPAQPERLRAILRAVATPLSTGRDDKPAAQKVDRERVEAILADLPPPLYVGGAVVSDEVLGDHDLKRLLHAYGVRVTRQAPANTVTAALRILGKLTLPIELLPAVSPRANIEEVLAEEANGKVLCRTLAEVKRQTTLLLSRHPYVLLRETRPQGPLLRVQVGAERGLGTIMRLEAGSGRGPLQAQLGEAALLPIFAGEAQKLCETIFANTPLLAEKGVDGKGLAELLCGVSACLDDHALMLDLLVQLGEEPVVVAAAGVLKRQAARRESRPN